MASTPAATMDDRIPPMPPHWILDGDPESPKYNGSLMQKVVLIIHSGFCAVTIGAGNLRPLWERCNTNEPGAWEEGRNSLRERIQHTNIVGGLLLTTIAAFCSTDPPKDSKFLPYTKEGPACLMLLAFGLSFAGLIVGSTIVLVIGNSRTGSWFADVMMGTRARIWLTMTLLGYPFFAIGASTCSLAAGLLVAASYSESPLIRYGGYSLVVSPLSCAFAFAWILTMKRNPGRVDSMGEEKV